MNPSCLAAISTMILVGCQGDEPQSPAPSSAGKPAVAQRKPTLTEARKGFQTKLIREEAAKEPVQAPPADLFRVVTYQSPKGPLAAYLSQPPKDDKKHPAIVWCFGGFSNSIGDTAWENSPPENDQSASAFRKAGILMMYPSLRGGNENPGFKEGFYGEVDDVLAAADFLAKQDHVDPKRIYLGGHSTGGTLALLAAESSDRFRGVFSLGPAASVAGYGPDNLPFDLSNRMELAVRAPILWLSSVRNPTFVFEGTAKPSNVDSLTQMAKLSSNPSLHFHPVKGLSHFSVIAPLTKLIAAKIIADDAPTNPMAFTDDELAQLSAR